MSKLEKEDSQRRKQIVMSGRRVTLPKNSGIKDGDVVFVETQGNKVIITATEVMERKI